MKKSTVIATCLLNSSIASDLRHGETMVRATFDQCFPDSNFADWNTEMKASVAATIVSEVGRATRINVEKFIRDLW